MGLISRVSSRLTDRKKWLFISTESYQTLTSESEKPGPNSQKLGSTNQPRKSLDDQHELLKPPPLPHDQLPVLFDPSSSAQLSGTTPKLESAEVSLMMNLKAQD